MELEREISRSLYRAIRDKYEAELYRDAILAATFYLEDVIKQRVHQTQPTLSVMNISEYFTSPDPVIQINAMSTVAEVFEQKGMEHLLLGISHGIRFSRTHAESCDNAKTADAIICFIDYLIQRLQVSTSKNLSTL